MAPRMGVLSKVLVASTGLAAAIHIAPTQKANVFLAADKKSLTFAQALAGGHGKQKSKLHWTSVSGKEMPPEVLKQIQELTGLGPVEGKTHEQAWHECEAAWKTCALAGCDGQEPCGPLATRSVTKADALEKCPNIKALADAGILRPDELPEHMTAEMYKEGCMCVNSPDGCQPPPYPGSDEVCESAWSACSAMEADPQLIVIDAVSRVTAASMCTGVMQAIEMGMIEAEYIPDPLMKADYLVGCKSFLATPPPEMPQPEHPGMAPAAYDPAGHHEMPMDTMLHPTMEGFPMPDENCWSSWDMCMESMHRVEDFALRPENMTMPPPHLPAGPSAGPPPALNGTGSGPVPLPAAQRTALLQQLSQSRYLHMYTSAVMNAMKKNHTFHNETAVVDLTEPMPPMHYDPRIDFHDLAKQGEDPRCHGVLHMLHEKAKGMSPAELEHIPPGLTGSEFVEHVCLPMLGAPEPYAEPYYHNETQGECDACLHGCGSDMGVKHEEIDATEACQACDHCHHGSALMMNTNGCEGVLDHMMGTTHPECHMHCDMSAECGMCQQAHEMVHMEMGQHFETCTRTCHETTCAVDGTFDHDPNMYEPHTTDMDDCVDCHRSCDGSPDCMHACDNVCGIVEHQMEMHDAHDPLIMGGVVPPPVGRERGAMEERAMSSAAAAATVPDPRPPLTGVRPPVREPEPTPEAVK